MQDKSDLEEILQVARRGSDFAEIFMERTESTRIGCEAGQIERVISGREQGAGIRAVRDGLTAYGYTNALDKESLLALADQVARAAQAEDTVPVVLQRRESPVDLPVKRRPDATPVEEKVALVREAESSARSQDEKLLRQVTVGYADTIQQVTIANTEGVYVEDERVRCRMSVNAVAAEGPVIQTGYDSEGGTRGFELFDDGETV